MLSKTFLANLMLGTTALVLIFFLLRWGLDSYTFHDQQIEVPSLIGLDLEETQIVTAEQKLSWQVLDSSEYNYAFGDSEVWDQYPRAGSRVKEGRAIKLTVNPVREPMIQLPDLIEKTIRRATYDLQTKGFVLGEISYVPYIGKDVVVRVLSDGEELKGRSFFTKGSVIDLVLGGGLSEQTTEVPFLGGLDLKTAKERLRSVSLNIGLVSWEESSMETSMDSSKARVHPESAGACPGRSAWDGCGYLAELGQYQMAHRYVGFSDERHCSNPDGFHACGIDCCFSYHSVPSVHPVFSSDHGTFGSGDDAFFSRP